MLPDPWHIYWAGRQFCKVVKLITILLMCIIIAAYARNNHIVASCNLSAMGCNITEISSLGKVPSSFKEQSKNYISLIFCFFCIRKNTINYY